MSLIRLFIIFMKIGAILLGGGYVILPILQSEFTEKQKLISQNDLMEFFALAQSLPGIVAANISMFIGYKLRGKVGALTAMLGIIFIPFICIVTLASVLKYFLNNPFILGIMWGIDIAVIVLIFLTAREVWQKSERNLFFYSLFLLALISLLILKLSPILVIIIFSILGVIIKLIGRCRK